MKISRTGNRWTVNKLTVNSYELFAVYGRILGKRPADITEQDVRNYLRWQKNPDRIKDSFQH